MDMPKHIRAAKTKLILPYFVTLSGAANFCACLLKPLERSFGYALRGFRKYSSKICIAQNG